MPVWWIRDQAAAIAPSWRIISISMPSRSPRSATQPRRRERVADPHQDGAAGEHQVRPVGTDAGVAGPLGVARGQEPLDHAGDVGVVHPDAVDAAAVVTQQVLVDACDGGHGAQEVPSRCMLVRLPPCSAANSCRCRATSATISAYNSRVTLRPPNCSASVATPSGIEAQPATGRDGARKIVRALQADQFGRSAADVEDRAIRRRIHQRQASGHRQRRLGFAIDHLELDAELAR